jgi:hypothetical protein
VILVAFPICAGKTRSVSRIQAKKNATTVRFFLNVF